MKKSWQEDYIQLVKFLGKALGSDYEVALHDLSNNDHSIVAIANSHVSGRNIDAPLSNLALQFIYTKEYQKNDYKLNYEGISVNNEKLRCSTMFIKDDDGKLLGMLCINFNQDKYSQFANQVFHFMRENYNLNTVSPGVDRLALDLVENFSESVTQTYNTIVYEMFGGNASPQNLTQDQKIEILSKLEKRGVFRIKGAIAEVAELIHSSVASVYRYLSAIRKESES